MIARNLSGKAVNVFYFAAGEVLRVICSLKVFMVTAYNVAVEFSVAMTKTEDFSDGWSEDVFMFLIVDRPGILSNDTERVLISVLCVLTVLALQHVVQEFLANIVKVCIKNTCMQIMYADVYIQMFV